MYRCNNLNLILKAEYLLFLENNPSDPGSQRFILTAVCSLLLSFSIGERFISVLKIIFFPENQHNLKEKKDDNKFIFWSSLNIIASCHFKFDIRVC